MQFARFLIGLLLLALTSIGLGGFSSYECKILSEQTVNGHGTLEEAKLDLYFGKSFHVARATGTVLGAGLDNSSYAEKVVFSRGSKEMSFRAIWISDETLAPGGGRHVDYLVIKEWATESTKPFILVTSTTVLTGLCT